MAAATEKSLKLSTPNILLLHKNIDIQVARAISSYWHYDKSSVTTSLGTAPHYRLQDPASRSLGDVNNRRLRLNECFMNQLFFKFSNARKLVWIVSYWNPSIGNFMFRIFLRFTTLDCLLRTAMTGTVRGVSNSLQFN